MPVPRYEGNVEQRPVSGVRVSTDAPIEAFGGGQGLENVQAAGRGVVSELEKYIIEERNKADQLAVLDADRQLSEFEIKTVNDALATRGKNAFGLPEKIRESFDKTTSEIEKGLNNDTQRMAFRRSATSRRGDVDRQIQRHVSREIMQYDDEVTNAYMANEQNAAATSYSDPDRVSLAIERQRAAIIDHAKRAGKPPEWEKQMILETASKTHSAVISKMLNNGEDILAKEYYAANKEEMTADDSQRIEKTVHDSTIRGESQRKADEIVAEYSDLEAARAAVKEINDPELRDAVDDRVKMEFQLQKQQDAINRDKLFMGAWDTLEKSPTKSVDEIPADQWSALLPSQKQALRTLEKQLKLPGEKVQDDTVYVKYIGMPDAQLARVTEAEIMEQVRPNLQDSYFKTVLTKWSKAREALNSPAAKNETKSMFSDEEIVLNAMKATKLAGIKDGDTMTEVSKNRGKSEAYRQLADAVDAQFAAWQHETGKAPNGEQKKKIVDEMVTRKVFVEKSWLWGQDPEKPVSTLTNDERGRSYVPLNKVPKPERNSIENVIRSKQKRITQSKIERAYAAYLIGDAQMFEAVVAE